MVTKIENLLRQNHELNCLQMVRWPARMNSEQISQVLGFQAHDIAVLVKKGYLKPLGGVLRNAVKYFAAIEIQCLCEDRVWLNQATKAIARRKQSSARQQNKFASNDLCFRKHASSDNSESRR